MVLVTTGMLPTLPVECRTRWWVPPMLSAYKLTVPQTGKENRPGLKALCAALLLPMPPKLVVERADQAHAAFDRRL